MIPGQVSFLHRSALNSSPFQWSGFSSSASPESNDKEAAQPENKKEAASVSNEKSESGSGTDSDSEIDLSKADLVKLVTEKEKELESMKDKVLRTYAEMENVKDRHMRESEKSKKFAIQVCGVIKFVYSTWLSGGATSLLQFAASLFLTQLFTRKKYAGFCKAPSRCS